MRGLCNYFRPGVSSAAFAYLRAFAWRRVFGWLRRKHPRSTWKDLRRKYCDAGWWPRDGQTALFNPAAVRTTRYRYRGTVIPSPPRGRRPQPPRGDGTCGEPDAVPSRTSGSGARPGETGWP